MFISFAILAVLNIVTGVFVDTAMQSSKNDRECIIQEELKDAEAYRANMATMFRELDSDESGTIGLNEFEAALEDRRMVMYFKALQLDITDARSLFLLLDKDREGSISIDEFLNGCTKLRGEAKSLDIAKIIFMCDWLVHNFKSHFQKRSHAGVDVSLSPSSAVLPWQR